MTFDVDVATEVEISKEAVIDGLYQHNSITDIFNDWPSEDEKESLKEEIKEG